MSNPGFCSVKPNNIRCTSAAFLIRRYAGTAKDDNPYHDAPHRHRRYGLLGRKCSLRVQVVPTVGDSLGANGAAAVQWIGDRLCGSIAKRVSLDISSLRPETW